MAEYYIRTGQCRALKKMLSHFSRKQRLELFRHEDLSASLHLALQKDSLELVAFLITKCGVDVDEPNEDGLTPLYHATRLGLAPMVRLLLRHGADICAADAGRKSCCYGPLLHEAVRSNNSEIVEMILGAGADPSVRNAAGELCLEAMSGTRVPFCVGNLIIEAIKKQLQISGIVGMNRQERLIGAANEMYRDRAVGKKTIETFCREDQIETMELCGVLHWKRGRGGMAKLAWVAAMKLRCKDPEDIMVKTEPEDSFARIIGMHEPQSLSELKELNRTPDTMDQQCLLILERILPLGSHTLNYACFCVRSFLRRNNPVLAASILRHAIKKLKNNPQTNSKHVFDTLEHVYNSSNATMQENIGFNTYLSALDAFTTCLQAATEQGGFCVRSDMERSNHDTDAKGLPCALCRRVNNLEHYCLATLTKLLEMADSAAPHELAQLERQTDTFLASTPWICGQTIFHRLSVLTMVYDYHSGLLERLLQSSVRLSGSLPHVGYPRHLVPDSQGSTPLLLMVSYLPKSMLASGDLVDSFLAHGAHLCTPNSKGQSARSILLEKGIKERPLLPPLICLSASAFVRMANWKKSLPETLNSVVEHFVQMH